MTNDELQRKVKAEVERRLHEASTSSERIEYDPSVPFPLEMLDPNLKDEPE